MTALSLVLMSSGCDEVRRAIDSDNYRARAGSHVWASKNDIFTAAAKCDVSNIKPIPAGDAWSITTKDGTFISKEKSHCIHNELDRQNLLVTK